jgi:hypothetical protein
MFKRFTTYCLFIFALVFITFSIHTYHKTISYATPINLPSNSQYWLNIILVPLDSRPPCTQFVEQLAQLARIKLTLPPPELLDNYNTPAQKQTLRNWLYEASKNADAAVISADMLIHGSLLASRLSSGTANDVTEVLNLLTAIHQETPQLKLYVFTIIPRLLIADSQENTRFQKNMIQYSVLEDQFYTFENPLDLNKLVKLEEQIPPEIIARYKNMYEHNTQLDLTLIDMTTQGILSGLIIGQDDGQPFGLPNINKQRIQNYVSQKPTLANKVFITRGTDEVALTMLGHIIMQATNQHPRIFVAYSDSEAPQVIMPYMPHTVAKTVQEKIELIDGLQVATPDEADFILYVHIGTKKSKNTALLPAAEQVKDLLNHGYKVALVDLAEDFYASETLLPTLLHQDADISKLIAYAGWNTTSNSIGTAVTQAAIFTKFLQNSTEMLTVLQLYKLNLEFLTARFLDDWYYQKDVQPYINSRLKEKKADPYNLASHYQQTNTLIRNIMRNKAQHLLQGSLYNRPITINTTLGTQVIVITALHIETYLPWQRTFEIWLQPQISLATLDDPR